ncbi:MAG: 2-C-methyl-D-erythritol 2,4-cyclodiphosphate synthase [Chitinivibrionales bacterium]|nr:2-C-methyl-D-erythritol 2,4-cyclodiphosphate synthase [Chitinivibrionales bacterium]
MVKTGLGQDSHVFESEGSAKELVLGGVVIPGCPGLAGNSDADVVLHALTNAVSGVTGVNVLGARSDELCLKGGVTDSSVYLREALLGLGDYRLCHVSVSVEAARPKLAPHIDAIKRSIAALCGLAPHDVGLTATTGEGLTAFGRGEGIQALVIVTASER